MKTNIIIGSGRRRRRRRRREMLFLCFCNEPDQVIVVRSNRRTLVLALHACIMETENFSRSQTRCLSAVDGPAQNVLTEKLRWIQLALHHHYHMSRMEWKWQCVLQLLRIVNVIMWLCAWYGYAWFCQYICFIRAASPTFGVFSVFNQHKYSIDNRPKFFYGVSSS